MIPPLHEIQAKKIAPTLVMMLVVPLFFGCGVALVPAPGATTLPGDNTAAFDEVAGVRMVVAPSRWSGNPANLEDIVTPLRVAIDNRSDQPLRIRYSEFVLAGPPGFTASALPPYQVEGTAVEPMFLPPTDYAGFYVAPHHEAYFPKAPAWRRPWDFDEFYYSSRYSLWARPLPSRDMLAKAIPEGVLEPRGHVAGFLFFEKLDKRLRRLDFTADLINAETGLRFGTIRIPFVFG